MALFDQRDQAVIDAAEAEVEGFCDVALTGARVFLQQTQNPKVDVLGFDLVSVSD